MLYLFILNFIVFIFQNVEGFDPLIQTNVGWIRGLRADDGDYNMFMGIPYATVNPQNPFGHSSPHPAFSDVFNAFDDAAICPQVEEFNNTTVGTLDCLHLNIYVPHSASQVSRNRLPVLVWIYGGALRIGFAGRYLYGPKFLVRHDIILVTINYRLGPYGFMCLDIPEVPGNQGLKDQELALKWVKNNIFSFGGDPERITVYGESAGGYSIALHLLSAEEKLFRNVIMHSGTALQSRLVRDSVPDAPQRVAAQLGFFTDDVYAAIEFLSTLDPISVIDAANRAGIQYRPCVEKRFDNITNFITDFPINMDVPKANGMNMMLGYNNHEQMINFVNGGPDYFARINPFLNRISNAFDFNAEKRDKVIKNVRQFYIGDEDISEKVRWELIDFDSDMSFVHATERSIKKYLKNGAGKLFYFIFAYNGGRNFVKQRHNMTVGGAAHADDIGYLFDISYMSDPNPEDQLVVDRMTTMWANFVKYDDPTPETSQLIPVKWEPITRGSPYYNMDIDSSLNLWKRPAHERMVFLDLLYAAYGKHQFDYRDRL